MFKRIVLGLITLGAVPGWATTSYFVGASTESAFDSAVLGGGLTASTIINFSGATGGGTNTVTQSGQTFFGVSGTLSVTGSNRLQENYNGSGTRMDVTPGSNVYALGLHLLTSSGSGVFCFEAPGAGDCGFDVNGGLAVFSSTVNFFGIVSSNPIPTFTIRAINAAQPLQVVDFKLGTMSVTPTPEPGTFAMFGLGLTALGLWSRKARRT